MGKWTHSSKLTEHDKKTIAKHVAKSSYAELMVLRVAIVLLVAAVIYKYT